MPELRTASALVSCTPYLRTGSGLVECGAMFYGSAGPVDAGSAPALTAAASPTFATGAVDRSGSATAVTNSVTATPTGGTAPYTFAWASADGELAATNPTSAATAFRGLVQSGQSITDTFTCTVADAKGKTATTAGVVATVYNYSNGVLY